ncbi:MAG: hypothetical protein JEZ14_24695 [Marinilabiliaceae bacterium]|nr:hypothetical protein [Marinilabiliaceae bacterium]
MGGVSMKPLDKALKTLNSLLNKAYFDSTLIVEVLKVIINKWHLKIVIADFEAHDEAQLEKYREEKIKGVRSQNYTWAAQNRDLAKECQKYVTIKDHFNLNKSQFISENGYLVYLYLGNCRNDEAMRQCVERLKS